MDILTISVKKVWHTEKRLKYLSMSYFSILLTISYWIHLNGHFYLTSGDSKYITTVIIPFISGTSINTSISPSIPFSRRVINDIEGHQRRVLDDSVEGTNRGTKPSLSLPQRNKRRKL